MLMTENHGDKLMINDVGRVFFGAPARGQVFVELPSEDGDNKEMVAELGFPAHRTRGAAQNWGEDCADTMIKACFVRGKASPCTFDH